MKMKHQMRGLKSNDIDLVIHEMLLGVFRDEQCSCHMNIKRSDTAELFNVDDGVGGAKK